MNISVCITTLNEGSSIGALLVALLGQSKKAEKIVIVDGGSTDKTVEIIRHYQKKDGRIKFLPQKCSRARGRNLAIEIARTDIIVMTDAGCVPQKHWLKRISGPFKNESVDVVAGFYKMVDPLTRSNPVMKGGSFYRAMSIFLGTQPKDFGPGYLPSTRSVAFRREVWEKVGGFPENLTGAAEDTVFNYKLVKEGVRISRVKDAVVEWGMPESISKFKSQISNYAKGDVRSKIWIFPGKNLTSHNIKALSIFARYIAGIILLILSFGLHISPAFLLIFVILYLTWAFRKVFLVFGDSKTAFWGPILQVVSDFGVMGGFLAGLIEN